MASSGRRLPWHFLRRAASALTFAALLTVAYWLYASREQLARIQWQGRWPLLLLLVALYGVSLLLNFVVWHSYTRSIAPISWRRDLQIYGYSNLSRRLPSGLAYLFVRTVRYQQEGVAAPAVVLFSVLELALQAASGLALAAAIWLAGQAAAGSPVYLQAAGLLLVVGVILFAAGRPAYGARLVAWLSGGRLSLPERSLGPLIWKWLIIYEIAWLNGGFMLYFLASGLSVDTMTWWQATALWAFSGAIGLVVGILPAGQLTRDASLSLLLRAFMPLPAAVVTALVFRLVLTAGDVLWSLLLAYAPMLTLKGYCKTGDRQLG